MFLYLSSSSLEFFEQELRVPIGSSFLILDVGDILDLYLLWKKELCLCWSAFIRDRGPRDAGPGVQTLPLESKQAGRARSQEPPRTLST